MENFRAMGLMALAMATFAGSDAIIKLLSADLSRGQILMFLGLGGSCFFWALCVGKKEKVLSPLMLHPVIVLRSVAELFAAISIFTALALAPLSTVSAIIQAVPLIITVFAVILFKEKVGPRRWCAVILGFVGVVIIVRPANGSLDASLLWAVAGAIGLSARDLGARAAPKSASTAQLSLYAYLPLIPGGIVFALLTDGFAPVDANMVALILGMNAFAVVGYLCITTATRIGEVSAVSPLRYTRLPFAAIVGFFLFAETPDTQTLLGSALIIGAGLFVMLREAQLKSS